jgi:hypothetical protein
MQHHLKVDDAPLLSLLRMQDLGCCTGSHAPLEWCGHHVRCGFYLNNIFEPKVTKMSLSKSKNNKKNQSKKTKTPRNVSRVILSFNCFN